MPAGFDACRAAGGRVRTVTLSKDSYRHVCWKNGKSYPGYKKKKKSKSKSKPKR